MPARVPASQSPPCMAPNRTDDPRKESYVNCPGGTDSNRGAIRHRVRYWSDTLGMADVAVSRLLPAEAWDVSRGRAAVAGNTLYFLGTPGSPNGTAYSKIFSGPSNQMGRSG